MHRQQAQRLLVHLHCEVPSVPPALRPDDNCLQRERQTQVWSALERLCPHHRRLVLLHHFEGCSYREISLLLGLALSTVKWQLATAVRTLREELACISPSD